MRPVIGITQCLDERGRWRPGRAYAYLDTDYAAAVESAGGIPLLLPVQSEASEVAARIDGLLLPGGDDFAPPDRSVYSADIQFDVVPERQLAFDRAVLAAAVERELPVLGICYGMQLLALEHGGTLHHHVPTDVPAAAPHRLADPDGRHDLALTPGTLIAEVLGAGPVTVNSLHHQAVSTPGQGLRASATAPDGIIEAIERTRGRNETPFTLGVQWHPEKLTEPPHQRLFEAFIAAC